MADGERVIGFTIYATRSGCYAYQVDGTSFSEVVVFRIKVTGHPVRPSNN